MKTEQADLFPRAATIRKKISRKLDARTRDHEKGKSKADIQRIVERVAEVRNVDGAMLFSRKRESEAIASARSMAMAACAAVGVPLCHIARAFNRSWACCYLREVENANKYRRSSRFRSEWETVTQDPSAIPLRLHELKH